MTYFAVGVKYLLLYAQKKISIPVVINKGHPSLDLIIPVGNSWPFNINDLLKISSSSGSVYEITMYDECE